MKKGLSIPNGGGGEEVTKLETTRAPSSARRKKGSELPEAFGNGRFTVHKKLGEGSFGMVFLGIDTRKDVQVAIKLEQMNSSASGQLGNESRIIDMLSRPTRPQGIVEVLHFGKEGNYAILVMDRLGYSFEDSVQVCGGTMKPGSVACAAEQGIKLLCFLHSKGLIHRDIKSENFMWGLGPKCHHLYMIDFGMSCKYFNKKHVSMSSGKDMTGTARYASINAMKGVTQSRRDDLESYAHVLIYAMRGSLPWSGLDAPSYREKLKRICETKASFPISELCADQPKEFETLLEYSRKLAFEELPQYGVLIRAFRDYREAQEPPFQDHHLEWLDPKKVNVDDLVPLVSDEPLPIAPEEALEAAAKVA